MSKISPVKPDELIRVLEKLGFERLRQSGSHIIFKHPEGRWTTVPMHKEKDVAKGTLRKILKDAEITYEDLKKLL